MVHTRSTEDGGLGPFDPQLYIEMDMDEFRRRCPDETKGLTDEQIYHVVSHADDDVSIEEWCVLFKKASI